METLLELFFSSIPYTENAAAELKSLSGHRVVEVHDDAVLFHFDDCALLDIAVTVQHRDDVTYDKEVLPYDSVDLEGVL